MRTNWKAFLKSMGPGVITGAADDDPSGIGTYSIAGAQLGFSMLWTSIITWPLMAAVQIMCARIGMVTGEGLAANLRRKIPRPLLIIICGALLVANTLNVGADLAAMGDAAEMLTHLPSSLFVIILGVGIALATVKLRYTQIANVLKWLALFLLSYVAVAFIVKPIWSEVFRVTFFPSLPKTHEEWAMLVAILGTTISPYLFFWQASQEVEEEKSHGLMSLESRKGASNEDLLNRKLDVGVGTFFSNLVMFFIILSTALTLHKNGMTHIETSRQAAEALVPLAGKTAAFLYTIGLLGVGLLAIPTLTGSAAYALAETFDWTEGLDASWTAASRFYAVILFSTFIGVILDFSGINPITALYWSAIVNGILAPFLLVVILIVSMDSKIMNDQPSSWVSRIVVAIAAIFMFVAAGAMFYI